MKGLKVLLISLGTAVFFAAGCVLGLAWLLGSTFGDMCGNRIAAEHDSPDARHRVVVFERDCGATTGFGAQVSVLARDETLGNESGNAFVVEALGDTPEQVNAGVSVFWNGPDEIVIHSSGVVKRAETEIDGVRIRYK